MPNLQSCLCVYPMDALKTPTVVAEVKELYDGLKIQCENQSTHPQKTGTLYKCVTNSVFPKRFSVRKSCDPRHTPAMTTGINDLPKWWENPRLSRSAKKKIVGELTSS